MALLSRVIQRIFGQNGGVDEFGEIGSRAAGTPQTTKNLTDIQSRNQYSLGWFSTTVRQILPSGEQADLPASEDFNSLFLLLTSQLAYLFQNGIPEWLNDPDQRYYANISFVQVNGVIYQAILGDDAANINAQRNPTTETMWWRRALFPMNQGVQTTDAVTFSTVNTGQGDNNVFPMDQAVGSTNAVSFATVNTGQGANELYPMNQGVQTTDAVTFDTVQSRSLTLDDNNAARAQLFIGLDNVYRFLEILNNNAAGGCKVGGLLVSSNFGLADPLRGDAVIERNITIGGTLDNGQGVTNVFPMNQPVRNTDNVTFNTVRQTSLGTRLQVDSTVTNAGDTFTIPSGKFIISIIAGAGQTTNLQFRNSLNQWVTLFSVANDTASFPIESDGTNVRVLKSSGANAVTIRRFSLTS